MRYLSVCSGIEAASLAWRALGWKTAAFSEIEAFPRAVLRHHYPEVPLHGDFTTIKGDEYGPIDLLVGGTPCQSFSVAGLRKGLADDRGNLALQFLALAGRARPRWIVWENVPGVLSSGGGRDFGSFLGGLAELGYGFAYRVLDAQHFGVPQRRRRVFVVGYLGDWRRAAAVLFERASLQGNLAPRREAGERIARPIASGSPGGSGYRNDADTADNLIAGTLGSNHGNIKAEHAWTGRLLPTLARCDTSSQQRYDAESETFVAFDTTQISSPGNYSNPQPGDPCHPLAATAHPPAVAYRTSPNCGAWETGERTDALTTGTDPTSTIVAFVQNSRSEVRLFAGDGSSDGAVSAEPGAQQQTYIAFSSKDNGGDAGATSRRCGAMGHAGSHPNAGGQVAVAVSLRGRDGGGSAELTEGAAPALRASQGGGDKPHVMTRSAVRRLTPLECERLQGFPDDFTLVPYRGSLAADGPRYRAIGNSMAVPVMGWIGERIAAVEALEELVAIGA